MMTPKIKDDWQFIVLVLSNNDWRIMPFEVSDTAFEDRWLDAKSKIVARYEELKRTKSFGESILIAKTEWLMEQVPYIP